MGLVGVGGGNKHSGNIWVLGIIGSIVVVSFASRRGLRIKKGSGQKKLKRKIYFSENFLLLKHENIQKNKRKKGWQ